MFDTFGHPDCINCCQLLVLGGIFGDSSAATLGISLKQMGKRSLKAKIQPNELVSHICGRQPIDLANGFVVSTVSSFPIDIHFLYSAVAPRTSLWLRSMAGCGDRFT